MSRGGDDLGLARYVAAVNRLPQLSREDELALARRFRAGDQAAGDELVEAHLRHVVKIAAGYRGYGLRIADLIEEGNVGLLEAVRRFDPERGLRFMTYAAYWVRACILTYVLKHWSIVGMGTGPLQSRLFFRLQRERSRLAETGASPGEVDEALAATFQTSEDRVRAMTGRLEGRDSSLDAAVYHDGDATMLDLMPAVGDTQEESFAAAERDAHVRALVARVAPTLDDREHLILEKRLLCAGDEATLAEIGDHLGLSRERVRQLEERLKRKLKRALEPLSVAA
jgi:RNA polymerase sigma-32 factor